MRVLLTDEEKRERRKASGRAYNERNKDKVKAYKKQWRFKNKDKVKAYTKAYDVNYRDNNKDKIKAYSKAYYWKNKDSQNAKNKAYRDNNKDKVKAYSKAYKENNRYRINSLASERRCRRFFATCKTSIKARREMIYLIASEISLETGIAHDVDHIIPISKGGINHEDFLMVTTYKYNCQKHAKLDHPLPEMQYLILDDLVQLYLKEV